MAVVVEHGRTFTRAWGCHSVAVKEIHLLDVLDLWGGQCQGQSRARGRGRENGQTEDTQDVKDNRDKKRWTGRARDRQTDETRSRRRAGWPGQDGSSEARIGDSRRARRLVQRH